MKSILENLSKRKFWVIVGVFFFINFLALCFRDLLSSYISKTDECNYIVAALQLLKGNRLIVDSWNILQFNGIVILPFVALFIWISGGTEGIILFIRIIYDLIKVGVAFWAVIKLYKVNKLNIMSGAAVLIFMYSTAYNIPALSYNTIPIICFFIILIGRYVNKDEKRTYVIYGVLYAIATLSNPYIVIMYFVGWIFVVFCSKDKNYKGLFSVKNYLWFSLGISIIATMILIYILSCCDINEVIINIKAIMTLSDHAVVEAGGLLSNRIVATFIEGVTLLFPITITNLICILFMIILRKNSKLQIYLSEFSLVISILYIMFFKNDFSAWFKENLVFVPFAWFAVEVLFFINDRRKYLRFIGPCFVYAIIVSKSSDTGILATSAAMCLVAVATLVMLGEKTVHTVISSNIINRIFLMIILVYVVIFRFCYLWTSDASLKNYWGRAKMGPLKGTFMGCLLEEYENDIMAFTSYKIDFDEKLCSASLDPLIYITNNCDYGIYSTVFRNIDYEAQIEFLNIHPDRVPDIVYYDDPIILSGANEFEKFIVDNYVIFHDEYGNTWYRKAME